MCIRDRISSLYNFVDSVFVARVSEDALTAISLAAPMQLIVSSLGLGNAVGLNAVISRALGEKNPKKVKDAASAAIFIACCSWILDRKSTRLNSSQSRASRMPSSA